MRIIDASLSSYIKNLIKDEKEIEIVSTADNLDILMDYIEFDDPECVIISKEIDENPMAEKLIKMLTKIKKENPLINLIILTPGFNKRLFQRFVNIGIYSIITYEEIEDELVGKIKAPSLEFDFEKYEMRPEKREYINKVTKGLKRVIAIYSKESTGKSFIASNLAYTLASQRVKTTLVDGDIKNRALSYYFFIPEEKRDRTLKNILEDSSIRDFEEYSIRLLDDKLNVFTMEKYNEDLEEIEINILASETRKVTKEEFIIDRFMSLIDYLRSKNEVVFIDVNGSLEDGITKRILRLADTILFVQNLDYRAMEENKKALVTLEKMNISIGKCVLVINRYFENKVLSERKIERYFNINFAGRTKILDYPEIAMKNLRFGRPAVALKDCSEKIIEDFYSLSEFCYGIEKIEKRRGGLGSKLLGFMRMK